MEKDFLKIVFMKFGLIGRGFAIFGSNWDTASGGGSRNASRGGRWSGLAKSEVLHTLGKEFSTSLIRAVFFAGAHLPFLWCLREGL